MVIGLSDKDRLNRSKPKDDDQLADCLSNPTPPALLAIALAFAQQNRLGAGGNVLVGGTDFAGYPNGRWPTDDVVDSSLMAVMGGLCVANGTTKALGFAGNTTDCTPAKVPLGATAFALHDAVDQAAVPFMSCFPYLATPVGGTK